MNNGMCKCVNQIYYFNMALHDCVNTFLMCYLMKTVTLPSSNILFIILIFPEKSPQCYASQRDLCWIFPISHLYKLTNTASIFTQTYINIPSHTDITLRCVGYLNVSQTANKHLNFLLHFFHSFKQASTTHQNQNWSLLRSIFTHTRNVILCTGAITVNIQ